MRTTLTLLCCLLGVGQAELRAEWPLNPRLVRGQELVYRGSLREQSSGQGVQFSKNYRLEVRALVLDAKPDATELGFLTRIITEQTITGEKADAAPATVRLEVAQIDSGGRLSAPNGVSTLIALDGPATWEHGFLVETPRAPVNEQSTWNVLEPGRPPRKYRVVGTEAVGATMCVKLSAEQKSEDWDKPRADSSAWRRSDTVWVSPRLGVACKVERELERRDPARKESTYRLVAQYEIDSTIRFDGQFFEDRKREVTRTQQFQDSVNALLPEYRKHGPQAFEAIVTKIDQHIDKTAATPYREALQRVRTLAMAGVKQNVPQQYVDQAPVERIAVGRRAPEFAVQDLLKKETVTLNRWKGKTVVLVFYQPGSDTTPFVFRYLQKVLEERKHAGLLLVGMSMSDDPESVKKLDGYVTVNFPTLAGKTLRTSYGVEATPRIVLLDGEGIVRGAYTGWGPEVPEALEAELAKCLAAARPAAPAAPAEGVKKASAP